MPVALHISPDRLDFLTDGERFTSYHPLLPVPGFAALNAPGRRAVTRPEAASGVSIWVAHGNVDGIAFGTDGSGEASSAAAGRIVSKEMTARRGALSVGFRQECYWLTPDGRKLLTEVRTARAARGPGEGRILDLTLHLHVAAETPVTLGPTEDALLMVRAAASLFPAGGGQLRNSQGDYGEEAIRGSRAAWCACVGVVEGETVGLALLDHPHNPDHPPVWPARTDGLLAPSPFGRRALQLAPREGVIARYRLLVHRGYVDQGWADARLAEFAVTAGS